VRFEYVEPLLPKLRNIDLGRLAGGTRARAAAAATAAAAAAAGAAAAAEGAAGGAAAAAGQAGGPAKLARRHDTGSVDAARQRYLQRKATAAAAAGKK
jgi:hypothetical protein